MGSEYKGSVPGPDQQQQPGSAVRSPQPQSEDDTVRRVTYSSAQDEEQMAEPTYREHVSRPLVLPPAANLLPPQQGRPPYNAQSYAPYPPAPPYAQGYQPFRPPVPSQQPYGYPHTTQSYGQYPTYPAAPPAYGQYPGYPAPAAPNGYAYQPMAYPGYYGYPPYNQYPAPPKRDGYLLGISIAAFSGSILAVLGGFACLCILFLFTLIPPGSATGSSSGAGTLFGGIVTIIALTIAGLVGGGFGLYHSMRSLFFKKPSRAFKLPQFSIFLGLYALLIVIGFLVRNSSQTFSNEPLIIFLIMLAGILPAMTVLALAVRRLRSADGKGTTTWRRATLAVVSGATSAIIFASIFELILMVFVAVAFRGNSFALDNPDMQIPHDPRSVLYLLVVVSLIAPLVEETVKPLAIVSMIGRINSAAEAFVLGMACGIGFDLIETSGYISQGYHDWLDVALQRSTAGLLHGFGAGMVALGWYFLTHKGSANRRILLGLACGGYAVLQHAIWNGSFVFQLLPAPLGPYLESGSIMIGSYPMPAFILVYIVESVLMLLFFLYVTGRLRKTRQSSPPPAARTDPAQQRPVQEAQLANRG